MCLFSFKCSLHCSALATSARPSANAPAITHPMHLLPARQWRLLLCTHHKQQVFVPLPSTGLQHSARADAQPPHSAVECLQVFTGGHITAAARMKGTDAC